MKKFSSIVFVILLLFNFLGYYGFFLGLLYQSAQQLALRLDSDNYKAADAVTLRIPIAIPYAPDSRDFERVDGEFEYNGEIYRLVKQRLYQDTLFVVCVRDHESKRIMQALTDHVRTFTDNPTGTNHKNTRAFPDFSKDYLYTSFELSSYAEGWHSSFAFCNIECPAVLLFLPIDSPPPKT